MKKILILCQRDITRAQMAAGYLNFFAGDKVKIQIASVETPEKQALLPIIMEEDNIGIRNQNIQLAHLLPKKKFDYLITMDKELPKKLIKKIKTQNHVYKKVKDPMDRKIDKEESFRKARERIKKFMLKFIGQELTETVLYQD